jgi:endonuclease-3
MRDISPVLDALAVDGEPPPARPSDPWAQAVAVACAYLVDDARRLATLDTLEQSIGLRPSQLLAASGPALEAAIAGGGMKPPMRAAKLRTAAQAALDAGLDAPGSLAALTASDPRAARRVLRACPGVSDSVAERILVGAGLAAGLPLESNGLRVLLRLGFAPETGTWAKDLRAAVDAVADPPMEPRSSWRAVALLRNHGQRICRRSAPRCRACALVESCPAASPVG